MTTTYYLIKTPGHLELTTMVPLPSDRVVGQYPSKAPAIEAARALGHYVGTVGEGLVDVYEYGDGPQ